MKLSEKQSKALQIVLGIAGGLGIWFFIAMPMLFQMPEDQVKNSIFGWLWVILFGAIMLIQRQLEKKYQKRFTYFFRAYLIALIAGLGLFILYAALSGKMFG